MPLACMSRITARVVSFALAAQADRAARAFATVCEATGLPSFVPLALAAASAALVRSLMRRASPWRNRRITVGRHIRQEPVHRLQPI